jgi:hypothetical protein
VSNFGRGNLRRCWSREDSSDESCAFTGSGAVTLSPFADRSCHCGRGRVPGGERDVRPVAAYDELDELRRNTAFLGPVRTNGGLAQVRAYHREKRALWRGHTQGDATSIQNRDASLHEALHRLRPHLAISWYSIAPADALNSVVARVTIGDATTPAVREIEHPLRGRALRTPRDRDLMSRAMHDSQFCRASLAARRSVEPRASA